MSQLRPAGIGNSPPARKVAFSPEMVLSVGSASVRITPARSRAFKVTLALVLLPNVPRNALPESGAPNALNGLAVVKSSTAKP